MSKFTHRIATSILIGFSSITPVMGQQNNPANDLLQQSRALIEQRDFDKAKLSLNLYQKYVEKLPLKWLYAQGELIKIAIEENKTAIAKGLFIEAEKLIGKNKLEKTRESQQISLLKSSYFTLQNNFIESNQILEALIKSFDDAEAETRLLNNTLDEAILNKLLFDKNADLKKITQKIATYEGSLLKNQIDIIRLKNKLSLLQNQDKKFQQDFAKLADFWIQKDEYSLLQIHLYTGLSEEVKALSLWEENKDIINIKTHPASVAILSNLADKIQSFNKKKSSELLKFCHLLIRNSNDLAKITEVEIDLLINEQKVGEAVATVEAFLKNNPAAYNAASLRTSVCLSLIKANDIKQCGSIFKLIDNKTVQGIELKSKINFIEASLLQDAGKEKEAAALFLRVGQTSQDKELIVSSLYQAGLSFEKTQQYKSAAIAFTQLIEQRRNKFTDSAYLRLYKVQTEAKDFKSALATIETIIQKSPTPSLKENALYDKGHILMKSGDTPTAIKAFYDFAVVYPKDSRSAQMLFEVFKIQKKTLKDLSNAAKTLDDIIAVSKDISPDIYAKSLHHRALLLQLSGKQRESITLWEKYLEFTRKLQHPLTDEVKLQLAAAYQNSPEYNQSAAASVYADIVATTKNKQYMEVAITNLASLEKNNEALKKAIINLLNKKQHLPDSILNIIFNWMHNVDFASHTDTLSRLNKQLKEIISQQKGVESFWKAQTAYFAGKLDSDKKKAAKAFKSSLKQLHSSQKEYIRKTALKILIYQQIADTKQVLNQNLNLIYYFHEHMSKDNYADWQIFFNACLDAVAILKKKNMISEIRSLRQRLIDSNLPGYGKVLEAIDDSLKVTVEKIEK